MKGYKRPLLTVPNSHYRGKKQKVSICSHCSRAAQILQSIHTLKNGIISLKGPSAVEVYSCMKQCLKFKLCNKLEPLFHNYIELDGSVGNIKQETLERAGVRTFQGKRTCLILLLCEDKLSREHINYIKNLSKTLPVLFVQESTQYLPLLHTLKESIKIIPCGIFQNTFLAHHLRRSNIKYLHNHYSNRDILNTFAITQTCLETVDDISDFDLLFRNDDNLQTYLLDNLIQTRKNTLQISQISQISTYKKQQYTNETTFNVVQNTMQLNTRVGLSKMEIINTLDYMIYNSEQSKNFDMSLSLFVPYRDINTRASLCAINERCRIFSHLKI
jgi:hypothetical protein